MYVFSLDLAYLFIINNHAFSVFSRSSYLSTVDWGLCLWWKLRWSVLFQSLTINVLPLEGFETARSQHRDSVITIRIEHSLVVEMYISTDVQDRKENKNIDTFSFVLFNWRKEFRNFFLRRERNSDLIPCTFLNKHLILTSKELHVILEESPSVREVHPRRVFRELVTGVERVTTKKRIYNVSYMLLCFITTQELMWTNLITYST